MFWTLYLARIYLKNYVSETVFISAFRRTRDEENHTVAESFSTDTLKIMGYGPL
jgi:hypothetical protein